MSFRRSSGWTAPSDFVLEFVEESQQQQKMLSWFMHISDRSLVRRNVRKTNFNMTRRTRRVVTSLACVVLTTKNFMDGLVGHLTVVPANPSACNILSVFFGPFFMLRNGRQDWLVAPSCSVHLYYFGLVGIENCVSLERAKRSLVGGRSLNDGVSGLEVAARLKAPLVGEREPGPRHGVPPWDVLNCAKGAGSVAVRVSC